jgi:hypothetical protein
MVNEIEPWIAHLKLDKNSVENILKSIVED